MTGYLIIGALLAIVLADTVVVVSFISVFCRLNRLEHSEKAGEWAEALAERG